MVFPARRSPRVLMKEATTFSELDVVKRYHIVKMGPSLFHDLGYSGGIHLVIVEPLELAECCAGRAANNPSRLLLFNISKSKRSIRLLGEVPWFPIWSGCPQIKGLKTGNIQVAQNVIGRIDYVPASIHFNECRVNGLVNYLLA